jgi:hypothetical protein
MNPLADTSLQPRGCDCDNCRSGDLPINPFVAPRVTHGMLLGEDDFATVIGYPRGKHQLHQAWLHGTGVVWGYPVRVAGRYELEIGPGLAIDALGRDIVLTGCRTLDLRELRDRAIKEGKLEKPDKPEKKAHKPKKAGAPDHGDSQCQTTTIHVCVVAEFEGCRTAPVPVVADPCDVNRTHDDYSRVIEQAQLSVRYGWCPDRRVGRYHRVRALLGLDEVGDDDKAGQQALEARETVLTAADPAAELEDQLREMACLDGIDLHPNPEDECAYGWFPYPEEDAAVILAEVDISLECRDGCWEFDDDPVVRQCVRTTLLPTDVITSLTAGLAPGLLGASGPTQQGPQVSVEKVRLEDERQKLIIPVTGSLVSGTVPGSIEITTLTPGGSDRGPWIVVDIYDASYDPTDKAIVVRLTSSLDARPATALVRVRIRGTGGKPVMGEDPLLPLAGVSGRPSGNPDEGHDAVWTFTNDLGRSTDAAEPAEGTTADGPEMTAKKVEE